MVCIVAGCRYRTTHNTSSHTCGTCLEKGHGQLECGSMDRIQKLRRKSHRSNTVYACTVDQCISPTDHETSAHYCDMCSMRGMCICPSISRTFILNQVDNTQPGQTTPLFNTENIIYKTCPQCKAFGKIDLSKFYYTNTECLICYEPSKMILFEECNHVNVCPKCVVMLD